MLCDRDGDIFFIKSSKNQVFIFAIPILMKTARKIINIIKFEICQEQQRARCVRNEVVNL